MAQRNHKIGIDGNKPLVDGRITQRLASPEIIADTGAAWVRINFVLDTFDTPTDPDWKRKFNQIVDQYLAEGMQIYALVGHESVKSKKVWLQSQMQDHRDQTGDKNSPDQWIADYVDSFAEIVTQFYPRVKIFETFNEPDNWYKGRSWIHPTWFAVMLDRIYQKIKVEMGLQDVTIVSGPLQGLWLKPGHNENAAKIYLRQAYQYGNEKLNWGTRQVPFDGVGYHLYIHEKYESNWEHQERLVRKRYKQYMEEMRDVVDRYDSPDKKFYLSEIGWHSTEDSDRAKKFQADNMELAIDLMVNDANVAIGIWFCTEDFDKANEKFYGLYQQGRPTPEGRKPAYNTFKRICERLIEESKGVAPPPEPSILQQIIGLIAQIAALYTGAKGTPPAVPTGTVQAQLDQLRQSLVPLGVAAITPANDLPAQVTQIKEAVTRLQANPPTKIGGGTPVPPLTGPLFQRIADLAKHISGLYRQAGQAAPAVPSGTIPSQLDLLRSTLTGLGVTVPTTQATKYLAQLAQIHDLAAQAGSGDGPPRGITPIPDQITTLAQQIGVLYVGAGESAPAAPTGNIPEQLGQLRQSLRPLGAVIPMPASNIKLQIAQIQEEVTKLQANPPTKIGGGGSPPPPPPPIGQTLFQQIADLANQISGLYRQAGRPAPATPAGNIPTRLNHLRTGISGLGVSIPSPLPANFLGQLAQIRQLIGQAGSTGGGETIDGGSTLGIITIPTQIATLAEQISALYVRAGRPAPAAPAGSLLGQLAQLRDMAIALGATTVTPATPIPAQISQLKEMIREVALKPIETGGASPEGGIVGGGSTSGGAGSAEIRQEIASLKHVMAQLQSQMKGMQNRLNQLGGTPPTGGPLPAQRPKPAMQNIVTKLPRHATVRFPTRSVAQIKRIIVHHTGMKPEVGAAAIARYRVTKQGWAGIGYHYFITPEGIIQATNPHTAIARHTGNHDADSLGICFAGSFQQAPPPAAQFEAGANLIAWLLQELGLTVTAVIGHKDIPVATDSPGIQWDQGAKWGAALKRRVQSL